MDNGPRIGFIGWNPFQFFHIKALAESIPGSCFVIEKRKEFISDFSDDILANPKVPFMVWDRSKMPTLDGVFDILVCQTPFFRIETFEKTKIAMIQYGYAKEPHNYGAWRSFGDLCLTYGPYASKKIEPLSPSVATGNPRYDVWHTKSFHATAKAKYAEQLDPRRKTVLYLPTWGDLSSVDDYLSSVYSLSNQYNILLKMHHNTELLEPDRKAAVSQGAVRHYGANDDLLELMALADVVISDYSGAIFDAIYCGKPIVLADKDISQQMGGNKIDDFSLEFSRRGDLGVICTQPSDLAACIEKAAKATDQDTPKSFDLKAELFTKTTTATENARQALMNLWEGKYEQSQTQKYIRTELKELFKTKRQLSIATKKLKDTK